MNKATLATLTISLLAACATTETYRPLNPENDAEAIVHIIREDVKPYGWALDVYVDGDKAAALANGSLTRFSVPAGKRALKVECDPASLTAGKVEATIDFKGRDARYFLVAEKDLRTAFEGFAYAFVSDRLQLQEVSPDYGERLVQKLGAGAAEGKSFAQELGAATSNKLTVVPVPPATPRELCIVENAAVKGDVLGVLRAALEEKGYSAKVLPPNAVNADCPTTVTYTAHFGWDIAVHLKSAEINVYAGDRLIGNAQYEVRSLAKFGSAEERIRELVAQLFPHDQGNLR